MSFQTIDFSLQRKYPIPLRFGQSILSNLSSQATRLYAIALKQHCIKHTATTSPVSIRMCCYLCLLVYFSRCLHRYPVAQYISTCWYSKVWYFKSQL